MWQRKKKVQRVWRGLGGLVRSYSLEIKEGMRAARRSHAPPRINIFILLISLHVNLYRICGLG
jgi:hypothetical protein